MDSYVKFWKKYIESCELDKYSMIEEIARIVDECMVIEKDEKLRIHCIASLLKSYIDDVIDICRYLSMKRVFEK